MDVQCYFIFDLFDKFLMMDLIEHSKLNLFEQLQILTLYPGTEQKETNNIKDFLFPFGILIKE